MERISSPWLSERCLVTFWDHLRSGEPNLCTGTWSLLKIFTHFVAGRTQFCRNIAAIHTRVRSELPRVIHKSLPSHHRALKCCILFPFDSTFRFLDCLTEICRKCLFRPIKLAIHICYFVLRTRDTPFGHVGHIRDFV